MRRIKQVAQLRQVRIEIDPAVRERHLERISSELLSTTSPVIAGSRLRRRLAAAATSVALVLGPGAVAIAAEGAVPGEALYPVKRVTETVRAVWDADIRAIHRLEEAEALLERGADSSLISDAMDAAAVAVASTSRSDLVGRLVSAQERFGVGVTPGGNTDPGPGSGDDPGGAEFSGQVDPNGDSTGGSGPAGSTLPGEAPAGQGSDRDAPGRESGEPPGSGGAPTGDQPAGQGGGGRP